MSDETVQLPPDSRIGQVVQGRYRILRKIGQGGMGAVYEGEHTAIKRKVAIKCMHAHIAHEADNVARFHREAMAANAIRHPNIIEVTDMGTFDDGSVFMVLEYLDGTPLSRVLRSEGAMPLRRAVHIVSQICDALAAAHEHGIVHRDLKPDNIYLCPRSDDQDFVKILDFGIAKFKDAGPQGITNTGVSMGTPHYMAPEQADSQEGLDHRADIYSVGVILFHAITGVLPITDPSFPMLIVKVMVQPARRLRELVPDAPPELDELVNKMLAKEPSQRPQSCTEVRAQLRAFGEISTVFGVSAEERAASMKGFHKTAPGGESGLPSLPSGLMTKPMGESFLPELTVQGPPPAMASDKPGRSFLPIAGGAIALMLLGGLLVAMVYPGLRGTDRAEARAEVPPEEEAEAADDAPEPAPPVATVRVQIDVQPAAAQLLLDGNRIANPFDADLPQTSQTRRLEARLEGYESQVRDLALMYPQRVSLVLRRGSGVDDRRRDRPPTTSAAEVSPPTQPAAETPPATEPATPRERPPRGFIEVPL